MFSGDTVAKRCFAGPFVIKRCFPEPVRGPFVTKRCFPERSVVSAKHSKPMATVSITKKMRFRVSRLRETREKIALKVCTSSGSFSRVVPEHSPETRNADLSEE
jgi:hypothetical protein